MQATMTLTDLGKPLFSLTVGEFLELQEKGVSQNAPILPGESKDKYVYGYEGGMKLFNCSRPTFYRILKSQRIAPAVRQIGRKVIIDAKMAMELIGQKQGGRK